MKKFGIVSALIFVTCFCFTGCYSVFSGGTGGVVVDAESTLSPKAGIANVDVYAYTRESDRDRDFKNWKDGTKFKPQTEYYGHTTTGSNGNFSISRLVWKAGFPDFGKDADYTKIFLLFYHENYGLTKGSTVIVSDSSTDTVYAELMKIKKETRLTLNFEDVSTGSNTNETIYVEISVPQTTERLDSEKPKVYKTDITGSGVVTVSYPRWQSAADREAGIETQPDILITYRQNADTVTWKGCYNGDSPDDDYSFNVNEKNETVVEKTIGGSSYKLTLYGKKTKLYVPAFEGQWGIKNGVTLTLYRSKDGGSTYDVNCGSVETQALTLGTNGTQKNGCFNGLGAGKYWFDDSYTGRECSGYYKIIDDASSSITREIGSGRDRVTIQKD